jgi:hypothetical protein
MDGEMLAIGGFALMLFTVFLVSNASPWKGPMFAAGVLFTVVGVIVDAWDRRGPA